ncbi:MAG: MBOAT family protein [Cytophagales bacterium]|nr:MBOAT family protein [Cytophagales bacterium]
MLFNSIEFGVFLPVVFVLYWFVTQSNLKLQNSLIVGASYLFYGWWDWRFLSLIAFSSCVDFFVGQKLVKTEDKGTRKALLWTSIIINLGFLGFFKYFNFFADSFATAFTFFGTPIEATRLNIILPVGISFYTFQTLSYTIDIYKKKLEPTNDFITFSAFVSFFPQLVAGPIERATHLLPQFYKKREFDYQRAVSGVQLIIWGLFKKMVIADNAAMIVNGVFNNYQNESWLSLLIGMVFFAFQIYGDFSGYSDIAIGTSRLFGFDLMTNFKFPYFSKNIREFWGRWHISLSTWFRDYVYIPLGGSKISQARTLINTFIVFVVSGFWHGANWTFIFWGFLHALFYLPMVLIKKGEKETSSFGFKDVFFILINFAVVVVAWVFFRAENITQAFDYLNNFIQFSGGGNFFRKTNSYLIMTLSAVLGIMIMLVVEYIAFRKNKSEVSFPSWLLIVFLILISFLGVFKDQSDFIYFQF